MACAHKNDQVHLLALDWAKAFDSINIDAIINALRRFGMPDALLRVNKEIHTGRVFQVSERGLLSAEHTHTEFKYLSGLPVVSILISGSRDHADARRVGEAWRSSQRSLRARSTG